MGRWLGSMERGGGGARPDGGVHRISSPLPPSPLRPQLLSLCALNLVPMNNGSEASRRWVRPGAPSRAGWGWGGGSDNQNHRRRGRLGRSPRLYRSDLWLRRGSAAARSHCPRPSAALECFGPDRLVAWNPAGAEVLE